MTELTRAEQTLRAHTDFLVPGDEGYREAVTAWNLAAVQRPFAVAVPRDLEAVIRVVRAAAQLGLRIAVQSTGHGAGTLADGDLSRTVLLRMHAFTGVTIDSEARTARVLGGTLWSQVVEAAAPHGLTALHGSAGDVAVAGFVLGGGLSFYSRRHGLAAHAVRAFEVVTSAGEVVRATPTQHPQLFWALRGGGGNFGAVVAVELDLLPMAEVYAGMMLWDLDRAPEVLPAWRDWTIGLTDSVTTSLRLMRFPAIPDLPPFLSGRRVLVIDGAVLEEDGRAAEILAPLRALRPEMDTFGRIPAAAMLGVHMDPPVPTAAVSDHLLLDELTDAAVEALLDEAGPAAETPLTIAELRHLGGALGVRQEAGALEWIRGNYAFLSLAMVPDPSLAPAAQQLVTAVAEALHPWANGSRFLNFAERRVDASVAYSEGAWAVLERVRTLYDPLRVWSASHAVGEGNAPADSALSGEVR